MLDKAALQYYKTIGELQGIISTSETLESALKGGLRLIVDSCGAQAAVVWYTDASENAQLRPYYWIGPMDITNRRHSIGEGAVGRVFEKQMPERYLEFKPECDAETLTDFEGEAIASMLAMPLSSTNEDLGVVQVIKTEEPFTEEEADLFEMLVLMAAIAIEENEALAAPWEHGDIVMSLRGITREFQNGEILTKVLKGVNLDVYEGEFLVLLGESGCGKSTLLNIIGGMDQATSGEISYLGQDLSHATQDELTEFRRNNIGFIFQSYNLMPNLNALQNLNLIAELVKEPRESEKVLQVVGLEDRMRSYPSQLSGGQQQRVSIARALVKNPHIILADEPTAALDYATSIEVLQVMEEVIKDGTTLVMVTHNEEITRMANRVVRMRDGRTHEVTVNRHPARATDLVW